MQKIYADRRRKLFSQMAVNSIAVLPGNSLQYRNGDAEYLFRQNSNFYYLTHFCEPDAVLVMIKTDSKEEFILFCKEKNPEDEIWHGPKNGIEEASKDFGADRAYDISELEKWIPTLLEDKDKIYYSLGHHREFDNRMLTWVNAVRAKLRSGVHAPETWLDLVAIIDNLRLFKDSTEIQCIKKACEISAEAHCQVMKSAAPGKSELALEGAFLQSCYNQGVRAMAYTPIVGGGKNACILHYIQNNQTLQSGDLVLVDAGCEYEYYASDITRTFPVNGKFSSDQKSIYELVLKSQLSAIEAIRPGLPWHKIQEKILEVLVKGLISLGILKGDPAKCIQEKAYQPYYMHSSGHWLGLDVHDSGEYKVQGEWRLLAPGMVFTVEPGLYFTPNTVGLDKRWWGIGVRIEDDILVTEHGCEVLTGKVPRTIADIEALMKNKETDLKKQAVY